VPDLQAVGQIRRRVLPFQRPPVARLRCLAGLQVIEGCPVTDHPGSLLQSDQSHEVSLDFDLAALTDQRKKVVADREWAIVVGFDEFQAHVIVTEVHSPIVRQGSRSPACDSIIGQFSRNKVITFKLSPVGLKRFRAAAALRQRNALRSSV
jgi:hypothetical protein